MQRIPMTVIGAELLRHELQNLKTVERPRIIKSIEEARAHGDLKENAEYHAAKEQQGFIEGRIKDIEAKLSQAQIIDIKSHTNQGRIIFGATVHLINSETEEKFCYQIVGEDEADLKVNKISVTSPIARAMIGKQEGDTVEVKAPSGIINYEITQVDYI